MARIAANGSEILVECAGVVAVTDMVDLMGVYAVVALVGFVAVCGISAVASVCFVVWQTSYYRLSLLLALQLS